MLPRARLVSLGWETKTGNRHIQVTSFKNTHILKVNRLEENLKSAIELLIVALAVLWSLLEEMQVMIDARRNSRIYAPETRNQARKLGIPELGGRGELRCSRGDSAGVHR